MSKLILSTFVLIMLLATSCSQKEEVKYTCITGTCFEDVNGIYESLSDCEDNCNSIVLFSCVGGNCAATVPGSYTTMSECEQYCRPQSYDCVNGDCVNATNGTYGSYVDCIDYCANPNTKFDCVNNNCEIAVNGAYASYGDCNDICGATGTNYDCVNGSCVESIFGVYTTLSNCEGACNSNYCSGSITDSRDGQSYDVVQIGSQCWFADNLRYSGGLTQVTSASSWLAINTNGTELAAWCYYDNNASYNTTYGKLYNFHAVNTGNLCPSGWHIPTEQEWTLLINHSGGEYVAGGYLKSETGWNSPNTGALDYYGFKGLPGGWRNFNGPFANFGDNAMWWSATGSSFAANTFGFETDSDDVEIGIAQSETGLSCRCIKD